MRLFRREKLMPFLAVSLLIMMVAVAVIALLIREKQKDEISTALAILKDSRQPVTQVENTLAALFMAENEFKEYALGYNKVHFGNYRFQVGLLISHLDTLQSMIAPFNPEAGKTEARKIIDERDREAGSYIRLKRLADSLMIITAAIESVPFENHDGPLTVRKFTARAGGLDIDTIDFSQTTGLRKKGLFGKIKTFLVGEEEQQTINAKVVVKQGETPPPQPDVAEDSDTTFSLHRFADDIISRSNSYYQTQMQRQLQRRNELRQSELKLVKLNNALMAEIRGILFALKETAVVNENVFRDQSARTITRSAGILHTSMIVSVFGAFLLALALAWMLRENHRYQLRLIASKQKAIEEAEEKRRFLAYMSHEFRTPLSSVIGFTEQLEQSGLNSEQTEYLSGILSSSEILLTTVNDILDLSKLEAGKMTFLNNPFRPEETIRQSVRSFESMIRERKLRIRVNSIKPGAVLIGDEIRLRQVLNNLISNAVKYTLKGTITLDASLIPGDIKAMLEISVKDTGIGMSSGQLDTVFDEYSRFSTGNSSRWVIGTGLGLPVTKKLVEEMGGRIEVRSEVGKGSVFIVRIPYETGDAGALPARIFDAGAVIHAPEARILIADDDYFNVLLLKTIFKRTGAKTEFTDNGEDALNKILSSKYDIILSDMYMPRMDGLELARRIRTLPDPEKSGTPLVMITGNVSSEATEQMKDAGVSDYLYKPFQQKDLFEVIGKYLS
ncbi:MAG: ATP-binding protein [Lentimicrobium sp.]